MKEKLDTSQPTHIEAHNFFFLTEKLVFLAHGYYFILVQYI